MNWFFGSLIGSISLVVLNTLSKLYSFSVTNVLILGLLSIITTFFFWYAWQNSVGFLRVWFIQSAIVTLGSFVANELVIKEPLKLETLLGISLILVGMAFLKWTG